MKEKKDASLTVRIPQSMRCALEEFAEFEEVKLSEGIRGVLAIGLHSIANPVGAIRLMTEEEMREFDKHLAKLEV